MSHEMSAAQIDQIAQTLSDPKALAKFQALLGLKTEETEEPASAVAHLPSTSTTIVASTATGANAGKSSRPEKPNAEIDANPRQDVEQASDIVALVRDIALPRRVTFNFNSYVPNLTGLFDVLALMDKLLSKTFKARRSNQMMFPYAHRLYFAILVSVQVARCMRYANAFESDEDLSFLETFLESFPPEKLAIPGPLLPFFKALTTYKVQNEQYARVFPKLPPNAIHSRGNDYHMTHNACGPIFPNVPVLTSLYNSARAAVVAGADATWHTAHWPFTLDPANQDDPQHYAANVTIGGYTFNADRNWNQFAAHNLNCPGARLRPLLVRDLYTNLRDNIEDWISAPAPGRQTTTLRQWLCMTQLRWFKSFIAPMSLYSTMWIGSGTLADCSVDGPAAAAYVNRYQPNADAPIDPNKAFDNAALFNLSTRMYTSQGTPEPVTERLAAFTQIHARLSTDHPMNQHIDANTYRLGNVWDARPLYGPGSQDYTYESIEESIRRFVQPHLLK